MISPESISWLASISNILFFSKYLSKAFFPISTFIGHHYEPGPMWPRYFSLEQSTEVSVLIIIEFCHDLTAI